MKWKFWQKGEPPAPTREQKDAAQLAEYAAFDNAVGATPTQSTLGQRFQDAVFKGYTQVVADTLKKGVTVPDELFTLWDDPLDWKAKPFFLEDRPMEVAVRNHWQDMVKLLAPVVNDKNLEEGLSTAEYNKDAEAARVIRAEMGNRTQKKTAAPAA